jgi:hypothetical protein
MGFNSLVGLRGARLKADAPECGVRVCSWVRTKAIEQRLQVYVL